MPPRIRQTIALLRRAVGNRPPLSFDPPARPLPEGVRLLFGIGAQKAGTSWLYQMLSQSAELHFSPFKELHYFDIRAHGGGAMYDKRSRRAAALAATLAAHPERCEKHDLEMLRNLTALLATYSGPRFGPERHRAYLDFLLEGCPPGSIACDFTPAYSALDRVTYADMASIGQARFLFSMRDPVSRMWSQIRMAAKARGTPQAEMEAACIAHARTLIDTGRLAEIERADYRRTMRELEAAVPADRVMYVFYEHLFAQGTVDTICDWLGIAPVPVDAERRVNEGRPVPIPEDIARVFRRTLAPQYRAAFRRFGGKVPSAWQRW